MHANCWVTYNVFLLGFAIQVKYIVGLDVSELLTFCNSHLFFLGGKCKVLCENGECFLVQMGFWEGGGSSAAATSCYLKILVLVGCVFSTASRKWR